MSVARTSVFWVIRLCGVQVDFDVSERRAASVFEVTGLHTDGY